MNIRPPVTTSNHPSGYHLALQHLREREGDRALLVVFKNPEYDGPVRLDVTWDQIGL